MAPIPYDNLVLNFTDDIIINHHARLFRVSLTTNPCIFFIHVLFINPKIKSASKKLTNFWHGCLSAKGQFRGQVSTYKSISYEALDENLNKVSGKLDGMAAVIFQHEFRHLLSNLYVDYATKLLDTEALNAELENGNYDDLDECDNSIPHLLSDYKIGSAI